MISTMFLKSNQTCAMTTMMMRKLGRAEQKLYSDGNADPVQQSWQQGICKFQPSDSFWVNEIEHLCFFFFFCLKNSYSISAVESADLEIP